MSDLISSLTSLISPSGEVTKIDWSALEGPLGVKLPPDYKQLIEHYGCGVFDDFLWILKPFQNNKNLDLGCQWKQQINALKALQHDFNEEIPYRLEPNPEIIPWGLTDNGDMCYWIRNSDDPASWVVATNESRSPEWETFDCGVVQFLTKTYARQIEPGIFAEIIPSSHPTFQTEQQFDESSNIGNVLHFD